MTVATPLRRLEVGRFAEIHAHFASQDLHLNRDVNTTRLRNYFLCLFSELALTQTDSGDFVTAGISYGTSPKVMSQYLSFAQRTRKWWLIDPLDGRGGPNYNTEPSLVLADLDNHAAQFKLIRRPIPEALDDIETRLSFVHLNTGSLDAELQALPTLIGMLESGGYLVMDYYGWAEPWRQVAVDDCLSNLSVLSFELPSLQLVVCKT